MFGLVEIDPSQLDDDELTAALREVQALRARLDAVELEVLAEWDKRKVWAADGSRTAGARLARETGVAQSTARERVRVASALRSYDLVRAAFGAGRVCWSKLRVLLGVVNERTKECFARDQELLVAQAERLSAEHLAIVLRHWERLVDEDGANASADDARKRAFLDLAESWGGEGFLKGRLDTESLAVVKGELDARADELYRSAKATLAADPESDAAASLLEPAHRRAMALVEMARRSAANTAAAAGGATVVPARPMVVMHVDVERNDGFTELIGRLSDGSPVSQDDVLRAVCDAAVMRAVTKGGSVPIDLGRASRDPTEAQRRWLASLWPTCAFPGCDLPYGWSELHHIVWWDEHGGPTDIANLLPQCSFHHHQCHRGVFTVERLPDGTIEFRTAAGDLIGHANPTIPQLLAPLRDVRRAA